MREIKINLTDEQEEFLKQFAEKQYPNSKDNLLTNNPIHLVQTQRERVVDPEFEDVDIIKYCVPDWGSESYDSSKELVKAYYEDEDCSIDIVSFETAYDDENFKDIEGEDCCVADEDDYFSAYGIKNDFYYKVHIAKYYETVAYFFILDEAKRYMKYQGHNLANPRTYTVGAGYDNEGEYHHFWKLLFNLGKKLNLEDLLLEVK